MKEVKRITGINCLVTSAWFILPLFLLFGACKKIHPTPMDVSTTLARIPSSCNLLINISDGKIILGPYRTVIEIAGPRWVNYVRENVDIYRYYECPVLYMSDGQPVTGISTSESGLRVADIALGKRTAVESATTIIHEAAHLSGIKQNNGHYFNEKYAKRMAENFLTDFFKNSWHGHDYDPRFRGLFITDLYGSRKKCFGCNIY